MVPPSQLSTTSTPDITPTEWKTTIGVVATVLVTLFGLDITDAQKAAALTAIVAVWAVAQVIGNSIVRHGRSTGIGAVIAGQLPPMDPAPLEEGDDANAEMVVEPEVTPADTPTVIKGKTKPAR
jgi:hypothetical protein